MTNEVSIVEDWEWASSRRRRTPSVPKILEHYGISPDARPFCFACEVPADEWRKLDRAHLVDHSRSGLDAEQNLVMLCKPCNWAMPSFVSGEGDAARQWVLDQPHHSQPRPVVSEIKRRTLPPVEFVWEGPVGVVDIAMMLGARRQTVAVWKTRGLLPEPDWERLGGPLWDAANITSWAKETGRL